MKLIYKIIIRMSVFYLLTMGIWAPLFYYVIMNEIHDEQDDMLTEYSETLMLECLTADSLTSDTRINNLDFYLTRITEEEAAATPHMLFSDREMYIHMRDEREPARVLETIFQNARGEHFKLTLYIPSIDNEDLIEAIFSWVVALLIVLIVLALAINILIYKSSMAPLHRLLGWIDGLKIDTATTPPDNPTDISEFRQLNRAVALFATRAHQDYERQKEFVGNASHEIQTPVAVCRNRLEMLADTDLTEEQLAEVMKTIQTLNYISRLNRTLLLLTKIDSHQFPDTEPIDINEQVRSLMEDFGMAYGHKEIDVECTEQGRFHTVMNGTLATTLLSNLLKNAFVHSPEKGRIAIAMAEGTLTISNTAEHGPLDGSRIFDRFYQGSKKEGSTGLGLAVVKAIATLYGMEIRYSYSDGMHNFRLAAQPQTGSPGSDKAERGKNNR